MIGRVIYVAFLVASLGVYPALAAPPPGAPPTGQGVTWHRDGAITWERLEHRRLSPKTVVRFSASLEPGASRVLSRGRAGVVEVDVRYRQLGGGPVRERIVGRMVIQPAKPRIVAEGIGGTGLSAFEARGIAQMVSIARGAFHMLATAYTAESAGGNGRTAIGRRAGYGIVAVDPRIIPLGTRLYIPGYGLAIAGDTGGDIVGNRIDLGFDSLRSAMLFGRRDVTVYRL